MSEDFIKPKVVEEEIILDATKIIMSKTDKFGVFEFANDYFMEISGYEEYELMGKSMFCIQHPDMPEVIFKMMWEKLLIKENFHVVIKNIAKSGKFYWSVTNFTFSENPNGEIKAIYSKRIGATRESITFFSKLYKTLKSIETLNGVGASEKYLSGFLEEKRLTKFSELMSRFYGSNVKPIIDNIPIKEIITELESPIDFSIALDEKPILPEKNTDAEQQLQDLKKKVEEVSQKLPKETTQKSLLQRMFGKTEEEIEAKKKRNN